MARVSFALRFPNQEAACSAVARLSAEDMAITWALDAEAEVSSSDELGRLRDYMNALARDLGGEFIGNGSFARRTDA